VARLPNIFDNYEVPWENWAHLDFLYGKDADTLLYSQIMNNIAKAEITFR